MSILDLYLNQKVGIQYVIRMDRFYDFRNDWNWHFSRTGLLSGVKRIKKRNAWITYPLTFLQEVSNLCNFPLHTF